MSVTSAAKPAKPMGAYEVEGLNVEHVAKISRKGSELLPKNWRDILI
jgi:hypothetical protein